MGYIGVILGFYWGSIGVVLGLYWDNGKENGKLLFRVQRAQLEGLGSSVEGREPGFSMFVSAKFKKKRLQALRGIAC